MREITLTQGKIALVDDEDYDELIKYSWCAHKNKYGWYAVRGIRVDCKNYLIRMHRQILRADRNVKVDHRDGNRLNNQKTNLRLATSSQNQQNRIIKRSGCSSKFKGVCWQKNRRKWIAYISDGEKRINGWSKLRHLGYFVNEEDAARAYDEAAKISFGEFAAVNFPD